jgi:hypothetical protein
MSPEEQEALILKSIRNGIRNRLGLGENECYITAVMVYVKGQGDMVIQIVPSDVSPEMSQEGGALLRKMNIILAFWYRLKIDQHQIHEQQLVQNQKGLSAFVERVRYLLSMTTLGGATLGTIWFTGKSQPQIYDEDEGIVLETMNYSAVYAENLPQYVTLTDEDVVPVLTP